MTRKRDIARPYPPDYVSAETLAYRLDISRSTLDDYVRLGHLPPPQELGTQRRWKFADVEAWINARNGLPVAGDTATALPSGTDDPYLTGARNVGNRRTAANA